MIQKHVFIVASLLCLVSCSSKPSTGGASEEPQWLHAPTRTVDSGYIVYIASSEAASPDQAVFKAESIAIGDLANECSFIPKGARIEDRYQKAGASGTTVWVKLGIVFEECEQAKNTDTPEDIRKMANVAMTEQLKRYQDAFYVAEAPEVESPGSETLPPAANPVVVINEPSYFIARQQIVYYKQVVILSPPGSYAPTSVETVRFMNEVSAPSQQVHQWTVAHPEVVHSPAAWSTIQHHPEVNFPPGFHRQGIGGIRPHYGAPGRPFYGVPVRPSTDEPKGKYKKRKRRRN